LYAGNRYAAHERWARVSHALSAPLLSAVLLGRAAKSLQSSGNLAQHRSALPHIAYMSSAWALGESVGYLLGQGQAERHWT
jgi:alkylation response protein AidB-like acyl-CoA dehydrogenase